MKVIKERIHLPDHSLRFLRFGLDAFRTELHRHTQLELTWIEQGQGVRFMGDSAAPFESGDLVLVGSELPHAWVSARADVRHASVASVLQFPVAMFEQQVLPELSALRPLMSRAERGLLISGPTHAAVTRCLRDMRETDDALARLVGLLEILRLLTLRAADLKPLAGRAAHSAHTANAGSAGSAEKRDLRPRRIDKLIQWIHAHLHEPLNAADAARVANVTPAAFSRFFKRETGKTYTNYVNDVRCAEACVLLRKSSRPVAGIAADCGFNTISNFNRQFLARMKSTPRAYRLRT